MDEMPKKKKDGTKKLEAAHKIVFILTRHYHDKYLHDTAGYHFQLRSHLPLVLLPETLLQHQHHHLLVVKPSMKST